MQRLVDSSKPTSRLDAVLSTLHPRSMLNFGTLSATAMISCEATTSVENGISILSTEVNQASHRQRMLQVMLVRRAPRVWGARNELQRAYLATEAWAAAIFAFTASRLKLAPFCIGGNSIAVIASFSTCC